MQPALSTTQLQYGIIIEQEETILRLSSLVDTLIGKDKRAGEQLAHIIDTAPDPE